MTSNTPLYKNHVLMLSQSFFIKDNRAELQLHAHKYDFDIAFFHEARTFVEAVAAARGNSLFVIDLDALHNMQADRGDGRRTLMLGELLHSLPADHDYIYLQSARQGGRFLLQQRLVDTHCLAYAEKPIANDVLVDKLFNLFIEKKRGDMVRAILLGEAPGWDEALLREFRVELVRHADPLSLHLRVKELQPDLVLITDTEYARTDSLVRVLKKNMEADPVREIVLLQGRADAPLCRRALDSGFDAILSGLEPELLAAQLVKRADKIRVNRDLIGKDRATGLLNKVGLQKKTQELVGQCARDGRRLAYGVIDIDKFKTINDTWGHSFGDIVIKRLSLVLQSQLGDGELLSRFGGEEFVVVLRDCSLEQGRQRIDTMRLAFGAIPFEVRPGEVKRFSFSAGVAGYPEFKSENELFLRADAMLYEAKQGGRNLVCAEKPVPARTATV